MLRIGSKTGIVRVVDDFGRIVIPTEVRRVLNLNHNTLTEYFFDDERKAIMVCKYRAKECLFCSNPEQILNFKRFYICIPCIQSLPPLQVFLERLERARPDEDNKTLPSNKKVKDGKDTTLNRLHKVMQENPVASQKN
ncbi:hypothetical protein SAMN04487970_10224 [Paenibacillus tianmuensis]|uniref:Transcriptional pleiotropic regulator of transition state genes n=1 Tax=Paenibacillus tianmuensis TaxID=624147 RepID=A0A1G4S1A1_9BACL|nr:hypothetical protein SAMN04487970_10224 [Paenibacillus tianmuensis]